jgi:hypothetical protein
VHRREEEATTNAQAAAIATVQEDPSKTLNSNIRAFMNGEETTAPGTNEADGDEQITAKKRGGSSKTSTKKKVGARQVSPQEQVASKKKVTTFMDEFVYPHSRITLEMAITLKSNKAFEEFMQAIMAFITNVQIVGPKFIINPLNPLSDTKPITMKGEISPNMTKLSTHIKISGRGNAYSKQKVWDKGEDDKNNSRKNCKANKKEDEYRDATVYFSMVVSSGVPPQEIIDCTTHEWARANGTRLQIKDLQYVDSETVVTVFKVSTQIPKPMILAEFKKILTSVQQMARDDYMDKENYDFTMELDVAIRESLPPMNLQIQNAKLKGQDVSTFNKLSHRAQYARTSWRLEVATKHATKIKGLVQMAKEYSIIEEYWGRHAHVSKVTDQKSTPQDKAKWQVDVAQAHTNYQVSMVCEDLIRFILLDESKEITHPTTGKSLGTYSLQYVLLNYLKMKEGYPMITEAHQEDILKPIHIILPNTPEAERMVGMTNKNLLALLWHMLIKQGLPEDFITGLLNKSCKARMLPEVTKCQWNTNFRTLTTVDEMNREEETKAFKGASWFKDEFGLLAKGLKQKKCATLEALFNLDGGGSVKTIHNCHKEPIVPQGTPPRRQKEKEVVDLIQTPPRKGKGKEEKGEVTDLTSKADRDSASQPGNLSSSSEEEEEKDKDDSSSNKEGSRSKTSNKDKDDPSVTGSG